MKKCHKKDKFWRVTCKMSATEKRKELTNKSLFNFKRFCIIINMFSCLSRLYSFMNCFLWQQNRNPHLFKWEIMFFFTFTKLTFFRLSSIWMSKGFAMVNRGIFLFRAVLFEFCSLLRKCRLRGHGSKPGLYDVVPSSGVVRGANLRW